MGWAAVRLAVGDWGAVPVALAVLTAVDACR